MHYTPDSLYFQGIMCPLGLIVCYLSLLKKLDYISEEDYLFPLVCAKYEKVLPTHGIEIQIPPNPVSYRTYEERFHRHSRQTALKNIRVTPNYSSSSFRQDRSRKLADNTLKSSLIWEIFHPKLSVDSSESSLDKPLHT